MTRGQSTSNDAELLRLVDAGNEEAFQILVDRYSGRIYTLVGGMLRDRAEIEDVVQDVFFKVYRKAGGFEGKSSFFTWLYRVALNTATDHLKKKRNEKARSVEDFAVLEVEADSSPPETGLSREELRQQLARAIGSLPAKYRDILVLREYEGCSYEEIAEVLSCSKGTVESRLFRARARLKDKLKPLLK